jgi:hypothetical protein
LVCIFPPFVGALVVPILPQYQAVSLVPDYVSVPIMPGYIAVSLAPDHQAVAIDPGNIAVPLL